MRCGSDRGALEPSEAFASKCSTGMGFQVFLECNGFFPASECQKCIDSPGTVFAGVCDPALIVGLETSSQVRGVADVVVVRGGLACEDIDVVKFP